MKKMRSALLGLSFLVLACGVILAVDRWRSEDVGLEAARTEQAWTAPSPSGASQQLVRIAVPAKDAASAFSRAQPVQDSDQHPDVGVSLVSRISDGLAGGAEKLPLYVLSYVAKCLELGVEGAVRAVDAEPLCDPGQRNAYDQAFLAKAGQLAQSGDADAQLALGLWYLKHGDAKREGAAALDAGGESGAVSGGAQPPAYQYPEYALASQYLQMAAPRSEAAAAALYWMRNYSYGSAAAR